MPHADHADVPKSVRDSDDPEAFYAHLCEQIAALLEPIGDEKLSWVRHCCCDCADRADLGVRESELAAVQRVRRLRSASQLVWGLLHAQGMWAVSVHELIAAALRAR